MLRTPALPLRYASGTAAALRGVRNGGRHSAGALRQYAREVVDPILVTFVICGARLAGVRI